MNRKTLFLISLLLSGCLGSFSQTPQQWRDSLAVLNKQISITPYSSDLYLRKAAVNIELQQWDYALDTYNEILKKDPTNLAALYYRAFVNGKMRRYDLSASDYEKMLTFAPTNIEARLGIAYTYIKRGKPTDALDQYGLIIEQHPDSAVAYASRACLEEEMQRYDIALYDWEKAVELQPSNNDYIYSKASLLVKMNRKKEARECLEELVRRGVATGEIQSMLMQCK